MTTITTHRTVDAPAAVVWDVVTDHDLYAEAAPNLSTVEVVDREGEPESEGEGTVRRCVDANGNEWTESCTRWEENRAYAVAVDVERSDFHRHLFTRFEGEWRLSEQADGVRITIEFEFEPRYGPLGALVSTVFAYKAPGIIEPIFDRWETEIRARTADAAAADSQDTRSGWSSNALSR